MSYAKVFAWTNCLIAFSFFLSAPRVGAEDALNLEDAMTAGLDAVHLASAESSLNERRRALAGRWNALRDRAQSETRSRAAAAKAASILSSLTKGDTLYFRNIDSFLSALEAKDLDSFERDLDAASKDLASLPQESATPAQTVWVNGVPCVVENSWLRCPGDVPRLVMGNRFTLSNGADCQLLGGMSSCSKPREKTPSEPQKQKASGAKKKLVLPRPIVTAPEPEAQPPAAKPRERVDQRKPAESRRKERADGEQKDKKVREEREHKEKETRERLDKQNREEREHKGKEAREHQEKQAREEREHREKETRERQDKQAREEREHKGKEAREKQDKQAREEREHREKENREHQEKQARERKK